MEQNQTLVLATKLLTQKPDENWLSMPFTQWTFSGEGGAVEHFEGASQGISQTSYFSVVSLILETVICKTSMSYSVDKICLNEQSAW